MKQYDLGDIGDIIEHKLGIKMIIIDITYNKEEGDTYTCKWFNKVTGEFSMDDFYEDELEGKNL